MFTQALFIGRCKKPIFLANKRFLSLPKQEPGNSRGKQRRPKKLGLNRNNRFEQIVLTVVSTEIMQIMHLRCPH